MLIFLGVLSIAVALIGGILFGIIGGITAMVLGALAIVFGIKRKKDPERKGGVGGMVTGIVGAVIGILMCLLFASAAKSLETKAREQGLTNLEKAAPGMKFGVVGIIKKSDDLGIDQDVLRDELERLKQ